MWVAFTNEQAVVHQPKHVFNQRVRGVSIAVCRSLSQQCAAILHPSNVLNLPSSRHSLLLLQLFSSAFVLNQLVIPFSCSILKWVIWRSMGESDYMRLDFRSPGTHWQFSRSPSPPRSPIYRFRRRYTYFRTCVLFVALTHSHVLLNRTCLQ